MDKRVKIKVTTNNVVTTDIDQVIPAETIAAFIAPYKEVTSDGTEVKTEINITNP